MEVRGRRRRGRKGGKRCVRELRNDEKIEKRCKGRDGMEERDGACGDSVKKKKR